MYGKMQESRFTETIPLICILTIEGRYPVFLHPEFPSGCTTGGLQGQQWLMAWWRATLFVYWNGRQHFFFFVHIGMNKKQRFIYIVQNLVYFRIYSKIKTKQKVLVPVKMGIHNTPWRLLPLSPLNATKILDKMHATATRGLWKINDSEQTGEREQNLKFPQTGKKIIIFLQYCPACTQGQPKTQKCSLGTEKEL